MIKYLLFGLMSCSLAWAEASAVGSYEVTFSADFQPQRGVAEASIRVSQSGHLLRLLDLAAASTGFRNFSGDGEIVREGERVLWKVPADGGTLHYQVKVEHERGLLLDAQMTEDWAIVRLDDLFPAARVRSRRGASSRSFLELHGPSGWQFESRYGAVSDTVSVATAERRFDRPTGWLAAGKLGIRREIIEHRKVSVAGPEDQGMRRLDIIAFLRWTLPELIEVFPDFPDRLLIVGAQDDMWRGGLSGPGSVYLHNDRPLISENATSTLLHELVHTASASAEVPREDWIIEGLAEYYSLEILRRSSGISKRRYKHTMDHLAAWAKRDHGQLVSPSSGANTARAVLVFALIQQELTKHSAGSLDTVTRKLLTANTIDSNQLLSLVEAALAAPCPPLRLALKTYTPSKT